MLTIFALNLLYVASYDVWDVWDFILPSLIATAIAVGRVLDGFDRDAPGRLARWTARTLPVLLIGLSAIHLAAGQDLIRHEAKSRWWTERAEARLAAVLPRAIICSPQWDDSTFLWYHAFRPDPPRPDVEIAHVPEPERVAAYVRGEVTLHLVQQRRSVAHGRPVYVIGDDYARWLADHGFALEPVQPDMYRVLP